MLTVFQMITLESWTQVMYNLMDSNMTWMAIFFSVSLILVGSFFLLNVILAVMAEAQRQVDDVYKDQEEAKIKSIAKSVRRAKKESMKTALMGRLSVIMSKDDGSNGI